MTIYIIIAISFALMFLFRYIKEIVYTVREVAKVHEVGTRLALLYSLGVMLFILSLVAMPAYAITVLFSNRQSLIKQWSRVILTKYYDVQLKI